MSKTLKSTISKYGFEIRKVLNDDMVFSNTSFEMTICYNPSGKYIGTVKDALTLTKKIGLTIIEAIGDNEVCTIGYNPIKRKWYGWSHRAIVGFKIGDKIFEKEFGDDKTPFIKHGKETIKTLADAKQSAINFANYVS